MAFSRVYLAGWASFEVLTSAQMNALDIDHSNAIDGAGGGVYSPSDPIEIGGAGFEVSGPFVASGGSPATFLDGLVALGTSLFSAISVAGNAAVTGDFSVGDESEFGGFVEMLDDLDVAGSGTFADLTAALFQAFAAAIGALTTTGAVDLQGTNTISGATTLSNILTKSGAGQVRQRVVNAPDSNAIISATTADIVVVRSPQVTAARSYMLTATGAAVGSEVEFLNYTGFVIDILNDSASPIGELPIVALSGFALDGRPGRAMCKYIDDGLTTRWMVTDAGSTEP